MKTVLSWLCALFFFSYGAGAQSLSYTKADSLFCLQVLDSLKHSQTKDAGERMIRVARFFLDKPYVAATLEGEPETLVVNFRELDCTTLVESVLALSQPVSSFADYTEALRGLRYRKGEVRYTERLHYIADWMYENGKRGLVKDITPELPGSKPLPLSLSFMSSHPESYSALKGHPERVARMREVEAAVNARSIYSFLPKERLGGAEKFIRNGDIIGFVTTIQGLDVTHLAIAYWATPQRLTFIHASSSARKVIVNSGSLETYLMRQKACRGIWVIRPNS